MPTGLFALERFTRIVGNASAGSNDGKISIVASSEDGGTVDGQHCDLSDDPGAFCEHSAFPA